MKKLNLNIFLKKSTIGLLSISMMAAALPTNAVSSLGTDQPLQSAHDFTIVAKEAIPAVVSIKVKGQGRSSASFFGDQNEDSNDMFGDDFWNRFFGGRRNAPKDTPSVTGQATGFIVSPDGYILTNSHVVKDMSEITVILNSGKEYPAKVIGADSNTDIALIKIDAKNLPYLKLGDSNDLEVGQWVVAIGNPLGLQASLTVGVVSAKGRNNLDLSGIEDFIQTDAAINRGNSGGPLLNLNSQVIGMNTAIVTNMATGGYMGIGFAIPSNLIKSVMDDLKQSGSFHRGFMGVVLQQVDHDLAQAFNLDNTEGALIAEVSKDSPAEKAGLKQGDIVVKYNNIPVTNIGALRNAVAMMKPGTAITLSILREGKPLSIKVNIGDFPSAQPIAATLKETKLGIEVENLTKETASKFGNTVDKGIIISNVDPQSPAAWAGLKKGALILEVNQKKVSNVNEFHDVLQKTPEGKPVLFLIKQGDTARYISFRVG